VRARAVPVVEEPGDLDRVEVGDGAGISREVHREEDKLRLADLHVRAPVRQAMRG
jgi:hypothetical protein